MISIIIPVYQSAETLGELHTRLCRALGSGPVPFEVIFVNDASPDHSAEVLAAMARQDARVTVLTLARNAGQQGALLHGLAAARGSVAVVLDADLQDPPEAIPRLIAGLDHGYDLVFAGRRGRYDGVVRRFTSHLFKSLLRWMCGTPTDAGLFLAMNQRMMARLLAYTERGPSVLAMIGCTGLRLTSIPVERAPRKSGRSGYSPWRRVRLGLLTLVWIARRQRPAEPERVRASSN